MADPGRGAWRSRVRCSSARTAIGVVAVLVLLAGCSRGHEDDSEAVERTTSTTIGTTVPMGPPPTSCGPTVTADVERLEPGLRVVAVHVPEKIKPQRFAKPDEDPGDQQNHGQRV